MGPRFRATVRQKSSAGLRWNEENNHAAFTFLLSITYGDAWLELGGKSRSKTLRLCILEDRPPRTASVDALFSHQEKKTARFGRNAQAFCLRRGFSVSKMQE